MNVNSSAQSPQVVRGRWGFYPCGVETYLKLKRLNALVHQSRVIAASWARWNRKQPQNRIVRQTLRDTAGRPVGRVPKLNDEGQVIPIPEPRRPIAAAFIRPPGKNFDIDVAEAIGLDYHNARYPKATEAEVTPLILTPAQIDEQIARYETWCG
ncbi:MAG: hypothetical protein JWL69_3267 [Phycisphaerales bacterium]|jgi:hypothetical protein|nr:hypothetical protein [Phycisphaerales bacterium]MDB5328930.1 hypothetical protein [Phycisphaerales bacterium]